MRSNLNSVILIVGFDVLELARVCVSVLTNINNVLAGWEVAVESTGDALRYSLDCARVCVECQSLELSLLLHWGILLFLLLCI